MTTAATTGSQTNSATGQCQIVEHDQNIIWRQLVKRHRLLHRLAAQVHERRRLQQHRLLTTTADCSIHCPTVELRSCLLIELISPGNPSEPDSQCVDYFE